MNTGDVESELHRDSSRLGRVSTRPDIVVRYAEHADGIVDMHLPDGRQRAAAAPRPRRLLAGRVGPQAHPPAGRRVPTRRVRGRDAGVPPHRRGRWLAATFDDIARRPPRCRCCSTTCRSRPPDHDGRRPLRRWTPRALARERGLPLDRVVALAPVGDLVDAYERDLDDGAVRDLLGDAVPAADPSPTRARPGCPSSCCTAPGHPGADAELTGLGRADPYVDLRVLQGVEHFALIDPESLVVARGAARRDR